MQEHPDITSALRTGYPRRCKGAECCRCGGIIRSGEDYFCERDMQYCTVCYESIVEDRRRTAD